MEGAAIPKRVSPKAQDVPVVMRLVASLVRSAPAGELSTQNAISMGTLTTPGVKGALV